MDISIRTGNAARVRTPCAVVGVFVQRVLSPSARAIDHACGGALSALLRRGDLDGRASQALLLHNLAGVTAERVLLVGLGKKEEFGDGAYRRAVARAARELSAIGVREAALFLAELENRDRDAAWRVRHAVDVVADALYRFDRLKSRKDDHPPALHKLQVFVPGRDDLRAAEGAARQGAAIVEGVRLARDLGNLPANLCTPLHLAEQARAMHRSHGLRVKIHDEKEIAKLGMGSFLSVAHGSRQPPRLIVAEYRGAERRRPPVVLIGKGITFDSGGISIKPADKMDEMKFDMCGAASVLGALAAAARLALPMNVVGIVPACENLPDGAANKPGDVVTSMSGQTIEILNTDAEGRLILCDALTYAERFRPEVVVDIATLTGACVVALGNHASGLMSNDDALANALLQAGLYTQDRAWRLPLWEDYQSQLDSNFADMANVGGRNAGAVTAACFLWRFARAYRWAHLDVAGTAWNTGKEKGATGRPVPLLAQFLIDRASASA